MSNKNPIEALMNALLSGNVQMVHIALGEGQSMEEAIAEFQAAHRAECPGCAAEYEAEQNEEAHDAMRAQLKAKHVDERQALQKQHAAERGAEAADMNPNMAAPYGEPHALIRAARDDAKREFEAKEKAYQVDLKSQQSERKPIGYMVFAMKDGKMTPVRGSFETDREVVTKKLAAFNILPQIEMLADLAKVLGRDLMEAHEIRPVYGD